MKVKIYRSDGDDGGFRYDTFDIETQPGMTVLNALFTIQEDYDDSLAFRYSCRGAVCGACAVLINRVPRLACRTQLDKILKGKDKIVLKSYPAIELEESWDAGEEILIEPLPYLKVIKDLVVDMEKFFMYYKMINPVLKPYEDLPEKEMLMQKVDVTELEEYTNCILCAACFSSCPENGENEEYLGPAALAKLYRFYIDPRDSRDDSLLMIANNTSGWWGCKFHANCKKVCPKGVPPNFGIGRARKHLDKAGGTPPEEA